MDKTGGVVGETTQADVQSLESICVYVCTCVYVGGGAEESWRSLASRGSGHR